MDIKKDIKLIFEDSNDMDVAYGTTVREVIKKVNDPNVIGLKINGALVTADYEITEDFTNIIITKIFF